VNTLLGKCSLRINSASGGYPPPPQGVVILRLIIVTDIIYLFARRINSNTGVVHDTMLNSLLVKCSPALDY